MRILRTSLRYQMIVFMLIATLIPIASSIAFTYFYTKESVKEQAITMNSKLISEGTTNLLNYMEVLNKASLILYNNKTLTSILSNGIKEEQSNAYVFTALQLVSKSAADIHQVYLHINKDDSSFLMSQNTFAREKLPPPTMPEAYHAPYEAWTEPTHNSSNYGFTSFAPNPSESVFSLQRPLYRVPTSNQVGFLSIDVKISALSRLSAQMYDSGTEDFYIMDQNQQIIFASDQAYDLPDIRKTLMAQIQSSGGESGSLEQHDGDFKGMVFYSKMKLPSLDWTIVKRIPDWKLYEDTRHLTAINALVAALFLAISLSILLIVSIRLTRPIKKLIRSMNQIQAGDLKYPIDVERRDEIGTLAIRFRTMMGTINDLILKEYKLGLANKTTQLKMLQAQINPHFMSNALQLIGATALESKAPKVYSLVSSLGQMMHYSMNTEDSVVPLYREIEHTNYYLVLQQERFEGKLHIETDIDPAASTCPIPKMTVQPLVENFFKHGFHSGTGSGRLRIEAQVKDSLLFISVEDNGTGIGDERLTQLRKQLTQLKAGFMIPGDGIGLMNVMSRLLLYYGEAADMELSSLSPHGLKVTLTIPIKQLEESSHESVDR
ncbi:sensor histidine kinase [Paenibacillus algorifonticola]|uniref:cache domain-containing sensor histidine kinase n=1 Tax=Paenibacillus algorifonticola TaxID=684063 RepID=UPI003D2B52D1